MEKKVLKATGWVQSHCGSPFSACVKLFCLFRFFSPLLLLLIRLLLLVLLLLVLLVRVLLVLLLLLLLLLQQTGFLHSKSSSLLPEGEKRTKNTGGGGEESQRWKYGEGEEKRTNDGNIVVCSNCLKQFSGGLLQAAPGDNL